MIKKYLQYVAYPAVMVATYTIYWALKLTGLPEILLVYVAVFSGILLVVSLEYYNPYRESWKPKLQNYIQDSIYLVFIQVFMPLAIRFAMIALLFKFGFNQGKVFDVWPSHLPVYLQVPLIIIVGEFFQYWWHRLSHKLSFLWGIHSVHHFPSILYSVNTARFHPCDKMVEYFIDIFIFIMLGAEFSVLYLYYIYFAINGFFQHSNTKVKLGVLNYFIASAELHRLHHDIDAKEAMHNFGNNTIIWDIAFGTYKDPNLHVGPIGVNDPKEPHSFLEQMLFPFTYYIKKYVIRLAMFIKYRKDWKNYVGLTESPNTNQLKTLMNIISKNSKTQFGVKYNFSNIKDYDDYKKVIEINEYEFFRPWIEKILKGEKKVLTADPVHYFVSTSGTTGKAKYIPMTEEAEKALKEMQNILIYSTYKYKEHTFQGKLFTVVGSAVEERVEDRFDCGSMSGKLYATTSKLITQLQAVPAEIYEIEKYNLKFLLLSSIALLSPTSTLFTTANPSTLIKLNHTINENRDELIKIIESWDFTLFCEDTDNEKIIDSINWDRYKPHRTFALKVLMAKNEIKIRDFWPNLESIITWTKGSCEYLMPNLKELIPENTSIIELGYLSSEFRGTVNVSGSNSRSLPTLGYNFFEFIPVENFESGVKDTLLIGDLEVGEEYYILVTTGTGLYRYFINDIVIATEKVGNTPCIEFRQKGKGVTNITGEKLTESHVLSYFSNHAPEVNFFICLADPSKMEYRLYYEGELKEFSKSLHTYLCSVNIEYKAKTESGRLKPVKVIQLKPGTGDFFKATQVAKGQRDSQLKHMHIDYVENVKFVFEAYKK